MFDQTLRFAFLKKQKLKNKSNKRPWWFPTGLTVALGDKYNAGLQRELMLVACVCLQPPALTLLKVIQGLDPTKALVASKVGGY